MKMQYTTSNRPNLPRAKTKADIPMFLWTHRKVMDNIRLEGMSWENGKVGALRLKDSDNKKLRVFGIKFYQKLLRIIQITASRG